MSDSGNTGPSPRSIGNAVGNSVNPHLKRINENVDSLAKEVRKTNRAIHELDGEISQLRRRIEQIEVEKARAQKEAVSDLVEELEGQYREKKREYERRVAGVLDDYRDSIERLKDRFLNSISSQKEHFEQVEAEFESVRDHRRSVQGAARASARSLTAAHEARLRTIGKSHEGFVGAIDDFLADREETAQTIDALQTPVPGVEGAATVTVPFWVVGIERDGSEELRVYPVLERSTPETDATREEPYVDYLSEHSVHNYADMVGAVGQYVRREEARNALAGSESEFSPATSLYGVRNGGVRDRFVEALEEYELSSRRVSRTSGGARGGSSGAGAGGRTATDRRETADGRDGGREEVTVDG